MPKEEWTLIVKAFFALCVASSVLLACEPQQPLFVSLPASETGIDFANALEVNDSFNAVIFEYIYNGGGVAAGDLNGDGLADLYFTGNQVSSRLYLNRGNFQFEDVTVAAGVGTQRWCTGVAMADVNQDGWTDLYVSVAGFEKPEAEMANLLFIHQGLDDRGIPRFSQQAAAYGLADTGYGTQAAFFDYDRDGDLDAYQLNNAMEKFNRNRIREKATDGSGASNDRLYRNNGDGTFTDVSREAGILTEGYGLGITVTDFNQDGWPDVYCANDFLSNDLMWVNNGDGTFTNRAADFTRHQTHNGMGVDIADINNDSRPEIAVLDMLPEDNYRQKLMVPNDNYDKFLLRLDYDYQPQYMRNTLQWHRGFLPNGEPRYSEIGFLAGMAATDWSWSVLFADLDNDTWKDAYITNGYRKDVTNLDYIRYADVGGMFGTEETKRVQAFQKMEELPEVEVANYLYHNRGDLTFENVAQEWGLGEPSFSNGAAYADLDNDGDLDLVVNNIDRPAFIYRNNLNDSGRKGPHPHFLRIRLDTHGSDVLSENTKVWVFAGGKTQYQEYTRYRGYKSSMEPFLHFGLGDSNGIDSLRVAWPDGTVQFLGAREPDQVLTIRYAPTGILPAVPRADPAQALFRRVNGERQILFQHAGNDFIDFKTTRTLPHMHAEGGSGLSVGDVNGDGLDDFFAGGDIGQPGSFFLQQPDGTFSGGEPLSDSVQLDMGSLLFDADQDGDLDLYVSSGGSHLPPGDPGYQDRLYRNDGKGHFSLDPEALPVLTASGSCVRAADFDGDGDLDLFVGGRILSGRYPLAPRSYLLRNEGGNFTDATEALAPDLLAPGLVSAARWSDYNGDGLIDLLLAGEWMPVLFFRNVGGQLVREDPYVTVSGASGPRPASEATVGWWNSLAAADMDLDGDMDYVLGNLGLNARLKASQNSPVRLYARDFDNNGAIDPIISYEQGGEEYALHARDNLIDQIAGMKARFRNFQSYAEADFDHTLSPEEQSQADIFAARMFASGILENMGEEGFRFHPFPLGAQIAPLFGMQVRDLNGDRLPDLVAGGNMYGAEQVLLGRYDASYGTVLLNRGDMAFETMNPLSAGFVVPGEGRSLAVLSAADGGTVMLAGQYADSLLAFQLLEAQAPVLFSPETLDAFLVAEFEDGSTLRFELPYGEGYIGQSSRRLALPEGVKRIRVWRFDGKERTADVGEGLFSQR